MGIPIIGTTPRNVGGGRTGIQRVGDFITIRLEGEQELVESLLRAAVRAGKEATPSLNKSCREALEPIMDAYRNSITKVTGNLAKSVTIRDIKGQRARGVGAAIGGPKHVKSGKEWDVEVKGAGNHAWLHEFGTGTRRPGTQGRRTPISVHQRINGRFTRIGDKTQWFRNDEFDRAGDGRYFIMSSFKEPTRQAKRGSGYPHDFIMALESGQTYGRMPPSHAMENAIRSQRAAAMNTLIEALKRQVTLVQRAA